MSQAFYRKWRPHLWNQVVSQDHVVRTLQNAVRTDRVGHAYLFAGPRGTGKTTTARLLAKAVNCLAEDPAQRPCDQCAHCKAVNEGRFLDLIEIDAASNTSVDDVRNLRDKINFTPMQGKKKVYIIDEVHMLSPAAFNALLKTLEEPPPHVIFILATTESHKIPATVLSRCQRHEFRRIPVNDILKLLKEIIEKEKLHIDDDALLLIARQSTGSMRDAISLVDQLTSSGEKVSLEMAQTVLGTATNQMIINLVDSILSHQSASGFNNIHQALDSGSDPRQFARQVVDYLRNLLLMHMGSIDQLEATQEMRAQMAKHAQAFELPQLLEAIKLFNNAASDRSTGWYPGLLLELALAEVIEVKPRPETAVPATAPSAPRHQTPARPTTSHAKPAPIESLKQAQPAAVEKPSAPPPSQNKTPSPAQDTTQSKVEPVSSGQPITLQDILQNWKKICAVVRQNNTNSPQTLGLLNSCKALAVKDGVLLLGFPSEILQSKMESGKNLEITRQALTTIFNSTLKISCTVMGSKISTDLPEPGEESDGIVNEAINLGGKIKQKKKETN